MIRSGPPRSLRVHPLIKEGNTEKRFPSCLRRGRRYAAGVVGDRWSQAIAVGGRAFVDKIQVALGFKVKHREVSGADGTYTLREPRCGYGIISRGESGPLRQMMSSSGRSPLYFLLTFVKSIFFRSVFNTNCCGAFILFLTTAHFSHKLTPLLHIFLSGHTEERRIPNI